MGTYSLNPRKKYCGVTIQKKPLWRNFAQYTLFFYKNIFYKNIEAEICEILRIF